MAAPVRPAAGRPSPLRCRTDVGELMQTTRQSPILRAHSGRRTCPACSRSKQPPAAATVPPVARTRRDERTARAFPPHATGRRRGPARGTRARAAVRRAAAVAGRLAPRRRPRTGGPGHRLGRLPERREPGPPRAPSRCDGSCSAGRRSTAPSGRPGRDGPARGASGGVRQRWQGVPMTRGAPASSVVAGGRRGRFGGPDRAAVGQPYSVWPA